MSEFIKVIDQRYYHVAGDIASFVVRATNPDLALLKTQLYCQEQIGRFKGKLAVVALIDDFSIEPLPPVEEVAREVVFTTTGLDSVTLHNIDVAGVLKADELIASGLTEIQKSDIVPELVSA